MRAADATTIFRTFLILLVVYLVIAKFSPYITVGIFIISIALDGVDGYLAVWQVSEGKVSFGQYLNAAISGNKKAKEEISKYKEKVAAQAKFGPRMDVAGDRVAEYSMWIVFTYVGIVPLIVLLLIVIRHSFADALMGARGTSSKMKTKFARLVYSSNASRAGINVLKIVTFSYLILMYGANYPALAGYVLVALLFIFVMLRGIAEIYECLIE